MLPRSRGSQVYLLLLIMVALGVALVVAGAWRLGLGMVGGAFVLSAVARIVVPQDHVGMLRVRGKTFDVVWTMFLGVSLLVLALAVPN